MSGGAGIRTQAVCLLSVYAMLPLQGNNRFPHWGDECGGNPWLDKGAIASLPPSLPSLGAPGTHLLCSLPQPVT